MVRKAVFDSLNLVSVSKEDMKKVDIRQEKPNFCPHLEENPEYDTIPYMNVSPFPFFFCSQIHPSKAFLTSLRLPSTRLGSMGKGRGLRCGL